MAGNAGRLWRFARNAGMNSTAEDQLVARARAGDADAFAELAEAHEQRVYQVALRFMRDPVAAQDMAQEALLKAFRLIGGFRGRSRFSTWLYRVTANVCYDELARRKRRGEVALEAHHLSERTEGPAPLARDEVLARVRDRVAELPENYATVLTLYYLHDIPYEEIARTLGVPEGTVKTWMHRARKALRASVEEDFHAHGIDWFE
jgi:RNA polymerase sigma-70 factor (ECF subfamily)